MYYQRPFTLPRLCHRRPKLRRYNAIAWADRAQNHSHGSLELNQSYYCTMMFSDFWRSTMANRGTGIAFHLDGGKLDYAIY
jgi:hypothetical protein